MALAFERGLLELEPVRVLGYRDAFEGRPVPFVPLPAPSSGASTAAILTAIVPSVNLPAINLPFAPIIAGS